MPDMIDDHIAGHTVLAVTSKCLAQSNKSRVGAKRLRMNGYRQSVDALLCRFKPSRTLS
jgi:hypothetical protein